MEFVLKDLITELIIILPIPIISEQRDSLAPLPIKSSEPTFLSIKNKKCYPTLSSPRNRKNF